MIVGRDDRLGAILPALLDDTEGPIVETSRDRAARDLTRDALPGPLAEAGVVAATVRPLSVNRGGIDIPVGVLLLVWHEPMSLTADDASTIAALADLIAVAVDRGRLASMILERSEWFERMAHTDPLTGLANERTFGRVLELELARAARQGSEISLAIFDVDGLTAINDTFGHGVGDDVLRAVASVLAESVRLVDTVARAGGDEFVLIAPGAAGPAVAQRVLDGVLAGAPVGGAAVSVSVGVVRFPADGTTAQELLAAANTALQQARATGPGHLVTSSAENADAEQPGPLGRRSRRRRDTGRDHRCGGSRRIRLRLEGDRHGDGLVRRRRHVVEVPDAVWRPR